MKNIVLTGFMGTGKTAVGRELSAMLGMKLIDIDAEIEHSQKMTINDIFKSYGESRFREIESELIKRFSEENNLIISTGGGAVLKKMNMDNLRRNGTIFCLNASPQAVLERTKSTEDRPLLKVADPLAKIRELFDFRRPFYEKAGTMIETEGKTPMQIAEEIVEIMKCKK